MTEEMLRLLAVQNREKENLLLCIDRAWGICARQARQARRRLRRLEGVLALTTEEIKLQPDASVPAAEEPRLGETQLEALSRRLAAAQQEIRQYETKLFACDRAILALKKENAELTALCNKARELGFVPEEEENTGPFWPDGLGPAPSEERPAAEEEPAEPAAFDEPEDEPAWLASPMELLEPPEPRKAPVMLPPEPEEEPREAAAPAAEQPPVRRRGPLDDMTSQVLGQLDLLMQKEHIPLKQSAYLRGKMD